MDSPAIALAALGGGLAAFLGLLLGAMMPGGGQGPGKRYAPILAIGLALLGARFAPPVLEPIVGQQIRALLGGDADAANEIDAQLLAPFETEPLFVAMGEADPDEVDRMRHLVEQEYQDAGLPAARRLTWDLNRELGRRALHTYGPRASDEALRQVYETTRDWGYSLQATPEHCYAEFYLDLGAAPADPSIYGEDGARIAGLHAAVAEVVRTAGADPVEFDVERVARARREVGVSVLQTHTEQDFRFMFGTVPQDASELQLACDVMLAMLDLMLAHEDSTSLLRASAASF